MQDVHVIANECNLSESSNIEVEHLLCQALLMDSRGPNPSQTCEEHGKADGLKPVGACHTNYLANYPIQRYCRLIFQPFTGRQFKLAFPDDLFVSGVSLKSALKYEPQWVFPSPSQLNTAVTPHP